MSREQILANIEKIKAIELDDLIFLERDLDFDEKASLLFLLCADENVRSKVVQQQLFVASFTQHEPTVFLHSWASEIQKTNSKWRDILLEALCIIQAKAIIRKLGLNYNDLEQRFLPLNPYNTVFVHPIVKLLYFVSEQLTVLESRQLIDRTVSKFKICENFKYTDNGERLEIYFMYWLTEDVLSIGRKTATIGNSIDEPKLQFPCNLEPIVEFLKQNEKDALKEIVSAVCRQFNSTRIAPTDRPTICTDENRPIDMDYTSCNFKGKNIQPNNTEHSYKIRKLNAGIVLIVNQNMFHHDKDPDLREHLPTRMLETRYGSDQDVSKLQSTFAAFGYRIEIRENLNDNDLLKAVRDVVIECAGKDSLIVCILSHGYKGVVYGANSIPVKITDIKDLMTSEKLISIPKILIVQACQGDVTQQAREIDYLHHDGPTSNSLPKNIDLVACISTVPGFTSIRHTENGSWFIQTLCDKITELAAHKHFIDILTVVCREVNKKRTRNNECMVPILHSTLRMDLFFPSN